MSANSTIPVVDWACSGNRAIKGEPLCARGVGIVPVAGNAVPHKRNDGSSDYNGRRQVSCCFRDFEEFEKDEAVAMLSSRAGTVAKIWDLARAGSWTWARIHMHGQLRLAHHPGPAGIIFQVPPVMAVQGNLNDFHFICFFSSFDL